MIVLQAVSKLTERLQYPQIPQCASTCLHNTAPLSPSLASAAGSYFVLNHQSTDQNAADFVVSDRLLLFDHSGIAIDEDLSLVGAEGELTVHPRHKISKDHLRYRREHYQANF